MCTPVPPPLAESVSPAGWGDVEMTTTTPPPVTPLKCITVRVTYDYEHHPLMPDIPLVANAIPSTFVSTSTAQINQ